MYHLIDGSPSLTSDSIIDGYPIRIPMLDIHTIGAGGGSIAYIDLGGGALRVGPESAGADPGPACYGKGDIPTVTDAHMVLGRIIPDLFLGGKMPLDRYRSTRALSSLANELGIDIHRTALGIIEIANAHMTRALQVISVERGYDPRDLHFSRIWRCRWTSCQ
jgi:N-methylhydantoinase A/oxoprolinase/acetone carboxylase beta subunit